ncbi:hypothetical protein THAOC_03202 [Thalassiosira oceanica]|uniref:Uncharacterized protein n=1 Tax=Thalassiosira oceanica TaxID=159749 RepID=K0TPY1_THAOC|nr:hypothetical protein THAOC_03202 [Thalassiosira oceanica]|eukprot:EJK75087.1 hypothetical protein THAOC_03202 [Thalassiosira oceanica]
MSRFSRSRLLPQGWEIRKDLGGKEKRMLHQQNRQNDRGPDEATTEWLGPWNRVANGPESSSTESSVPLAMRRCGVDGSGRLRRGGFGGFGGLHSASVTLLSRRADVREQAYRLGMGPWHHQPVGF